MAEDRKATARVGDRGEDATNVEIIFFFEEDCGDGCSLPSRVK